MMLPTTVIIGTMGSLAIRAIAGIEEIAIDPLNAPMTGRIPSGMERMQGFPPSHYPQIRRHQTRPRVP